MSGAQSAWMLAGIVVYVAFVIGVGWWASRRIKTDRDYIVAGGQLGWMLSIGTLFATWFGAETCMGSSQTAYGKGFLGVIADPFGAGLCLILSGVFFARYFRERNYETIVDFFRDRYGRGVAWVLSILYIPVYLGWIGAQLLAFGYILNSLTGFPETASILISTAVVLTYTYLGGMWADTILDFFQMVIIVVGLLVVFPVLVGDLGGWGEAVARAPAGAFRLYPEDATAADWLWYLQAWMMVGVGSLPAQDLFSRTMAPKSPSVARWASVIAGGAYVVIGLLPVLIGIFGRAALPGYEGNSILIDVAIKYLSTPMLVLLLGALLGAIMSSADSAILAPSSIIGHNLVPLVRPSASEGTKLAWCKYSVPVLGLLSLGMALYFNNIYQLCQEAWGILLAGVAAPMIAGVFWKGATSRGALAGALAGIGSFLALKLTQETYPPNLAGFAVSGVVLVGVSLLSGGRAVEGEAKPDAGAVG
jgi:SSS family transporter